MGHFVKAVNAATALARRLEAVSLSHPSLPLASSSVLYIGQHSCMKVESDSKEARWSTFFYLRLIMQAICPAVAAEGGIEMFNFTQHTSFSSLLLQVFTLSHGPLDKSLPPASGRSPLVRRRANICQKAMPGTAARVRSGCRLSPSHPNPIHGWRAKECGME